MLYSTDTTMTLMKQISAVPELSNFAELCQLSNYWYSLLNSIYIDYTVFAPTNDALTGTAWAEMDETDARLFVSRYIITNRKIFTAAQTPGLGRIFILQHSIAGLI